MKNISILVFTLFLATLASYAQISNSNLPIILVETTAPLTDIQTQATLKIIDHASGINSSSDVPTFSGMIGVKIRGNINDPKLSLNIETWSAPTVSLDTSLLQMPSENDWVLLASYVDRSFARAILANHMFQSMGRYSPRFKFCEVMIDNVYKGVYLFGEKVKRDSNRVDIAKLSVTDNGGTQLTGGYILSVDNGNNGFTSAYNPPNGTAGQTVDFLYEYPDAGVITQVQKDYIKNYVDSFENALFGANFQDTIAGWRKFGAENNFADYMIVNEISRDYDAYRKNMYIYKDKNGKLRPGPMWGNEVSFANTTDCNSNSINGWAYDIGSVCSTNGKLPAFWWSKLATDTAFVRNLKCRYSQYRKTGNFLDTTKLFSVLDSLDLKLNANGALTRNFTTWPIWGVPLVNEPMPMPTNYAGEKAAIKDYIRKRLGWLDTQWFTTNCAAPLQTSQVNAGQVSIYPNPATDFIQIYLPDASLYSITIQSMYGSKLMQFQATQFVQISTSSLPAGVYTVHVANHQQHYIQKIIVDK